MENLDAGRSAGLQLEEVESAKVGGEKVWRITLSMIDPTVPFPLGQKRDYEIFTVLKRNGEVISMKIRELATQ